MTSLIRVGEDVMASLNSPEHPPVILKLLYKRLAVHGGYYNHRLILKSRETNKEQQKIEVITSSVDILRFIVLSAPKSHKSHFSHTSHTSHHCKSELIQTS